MQQCDEIKTYVRFAERNLFAVRFVLLPGYRVTKCFFPGLRKMAPGNAWEKGTMLRCLMHRAGCRERLPSVQFHIIDQHLVLGLGACIPKDIDVAGFVGTEQNG